MDIYDLLSVPQERRLIENLPFDQYQTIPALRSGVIKDGLDEDANHEVLISPLHIKESYEGQLTKDSESMQFGRALHSLLLTPDEFAEHFCFYEGRRDERTKAYQEFLEDNRGKEILKKSGPMSWDWCMQAAMSLCKDSAVQPYIASGISEVTGLAPLDGLPCKSRFDWLSTSEGAIVDVKTTRTIGPRRFWGEWSRYGYGIQLALYQQVYREIFGVHLPVVVVAIENCPPFSSVVYSVPDDLLEQYLGTVMDVIGKVKECLETREWPNFAHGKVLPLAVPDYAMDVADTLDWSD